MKVVCLLTVLMSLTGLITGCGEDEQTEDTWNNADIARVITGNDGAEMVLIPAGEFQMGDSFNEGDDDELPVHPVYVDVFYMDRYEVTNTKYRKFVDATDYQAPEYWSDPKYNPANFPVVGVSWDDAVAYAEWADKRLPTEAEWEKAARGGLLGKRYPWGDELTHDDANYGGVAGKDIWDGASPVGSFASNGYGLYDMAGNVMEWCLDRYDEDYYLRLPYNNPRRVISDYSEEDIVGRGGSWWQSAEWLRVACRQHQDDEDDNTGFRCVVDAEELENE